MAVARALGPNDKGLLTYAAAQELPLGSLVMVPFGNRAAQAGIIWAKAAKPGFKTKAIERILPVRPLSSKRRQFIGWLADYYGSGLASAVQLALPPDLSTFKEAETDGLVTEKTDGNPPPLTADQQRVLDAISKATGRTHILHAVTGAGKTRIYQELATATLKAGRDVLILVPEIALSTQTHGQLNNRFGASVELYHSRLPAGRRRKLWIQALESNRPAGVWLGTRSALFLPLDRLGLIVIDECHDNSYKHSAPPRYQAVYAAAELARLYSAKLIMGSATPAVNDIYYATLKGLPVHHIRQPVRPVAAKVELVDLRDKSLRSEASAWLSRKLVDELAACLERGDQALLFLNRRGHASLILCANCGWQALCPNCHLPQTYHADRHQRVCHVCNRKQPMLINCPDCGGAELLLRGCGTKEIERQVAKLFPEARLLRLDSDNFKAAQFKASYQALRRREVDIIIGTQMAAKGFDLPGITLVGVIHADAPLSLPDFAAAERTYQLLHQVIGRGGRGGDRLSVVVQTYRPNHPIVQAAIRRDWQSFYESELLSRRAGGFPPYRFILKISVRRPSDQAAATALDKIIDSLPKGVRWLGPGPALHHKKGKLRVWNLVIFSRSRRLLLTLANQVPDKYITDMDAIDLL